MNGCSQKRKDMDMSSNVRMREIFEKTISNSSNALEMLNMIPSTCGYDGLVDDVSDILCSIRDDAKSATLLPRRNCDVGTPMEQAHRFHTFCIAHQSAIRGMCDPGCPLVENCTDMCQCICTWMQMPYEEGENNGRGS